MKVLFSNPPWWGEAREARLADGRAARVWQGGVRAGSRWPFMTPVRSAPGRAVFGDYLPYPFFMGHAASWVARETGAEVSFRDSIALREPYDNYFRFLAAGRFDLVFVESASPSWEHDRALLARIRETLPDARLCVTGPIAARGAAVFDEAPVDACIRGEYEKGAVAVCGGADGLIDYDLLSVDEMNGAPFPFIDDLHAQRYWDPNPKGMRPPQAQAWTSRGCPYKCIFCVWPAVMTGNDPDGTGKRRVRQHSADYVEALLTDRVGRFGYRSVYFDDDTFNLGDRHVESICAVMRRLKLPWTAMCRADTSRMDLWREMKESGCIGVKIGFESGNQEVVDRIVNKRLDLEEARRAVAEIKRVGMTVHGTFTYGLPGETPGQMLDTKRYIASLGLDTCQESGTAEIEGTPLHTLARTGGLERYAGARLDEAYLREGDGMAKLRHLAERLGKGDR